jgi:hypothetical protein
MKEGRVLKQALWYRPKGRKILVDNAEDGIHAKTEQANVLILELEKKKKT